MAAKAPVACRIQPGICFSKSSLTLGKIAMTFKRTSFVDIFGRHNSASSCAAFLFSICLLLSPSFYQSSYASDKPDSSRGALLVFAGAPSGQGYRDGSLAVARFSYPSGLTADKSGNILVADSRNSVIRRIAPNGKVSTLAGSVGRIGSADGESSAAQFNGPADVEVDATGNVYVADSGNSTIRKISPQGKVTTFAGVAKKTGSTDGTGIAALFNSPAGVAVDGMGDLYVADSGNNAIRKITASGVVTTLAGKAGVSGSADGTAAAALFNGPNSIALDQTGNLYITDTGNNTIRKITLEGVVSTVAGTAGQSGTVDGIGAAARFNGPGGIVCDNAGNLYVADA